MNILQIQDFLKRLPNKSKIINQCIVNPEVKNGKVYFDIKENISIDFCFNQINEFIENYWNKDVLYMEIWVAKYNLNGELLHMYELNDMIFNNKSLHNNFVSKVQRLSADFKKNKFYNNQLCSLGIHDISISESSTYGNVKDTITNTYNVVPVGMKSIFCDACGNHSRGNLAKFFLNKQRLAKKIRRIFPNFCQSIGYK